MAVIAGMVMVPIATIVGAGIDYSSAAKEQTAIQDALDSAALVYARTLSETRSKKEAKRNGRRVYEANCTAAQCSQVQKPVFKLRKDNTVYATVASSVDTTLLAIAGFDKIDVSANTEVAMGGKFQTFYMAIDVSASMGIAADATEQAKLKDLTAPFLRRDMRWSMHRDGCAFACHERDGWEENGKSSYDMARDAGIVLREDVKLDAVKKTLQAILDSATGKNKKQIQTAAYAFSDDVDEVSKLTANATKIIADIDNITTRRWGTHYDDVMPELTSIVGESGSGESKKDPVKTLILITDGVETHYGDGFSPRADAFDSRYCDELKRNGVRVVVVNIEYVEDRDDMVFQQMVSRFYNDIDDELQECASEDSYYTANDGVEIEETLLRMAGDIVQTEMRLVR